MTEIWNDIKGYEGLYQVSNQGHVKSLKRNGTLGGILSPETCRGGYKRVVLCKNNIKKKALVHRLVAEAFIENPLNLPQVDHIDGNKANNCVENLQWLSAAANTQKSAGFKVICLETGIVYNSIREAARETNSDQGGIGMCCKGTRKTCNKKHWQYYREVDE